MSRVFLILPNPCSPGRWLALAVEWERVREAESIASSCFLWRRYRPFTFAEGETPDEAVRNLFDAEGASVSSSEGDEA